MVCCAAADIAVTVNSVTSLTVIPATFGAITEPSAYSGPQVEMGQSSSGWQEVMVDLESDLRSKLICLTRLFFSGCRRHSHTL